MGRIIGELFRLLDVTNECEKEIIKTLKFYT